MTDLVRTIEGQGTRWRRAFMVVVGLSVLSSGASAGAILMVRAADEANCDRSNERFATVRDYLDDIIDQDAIDDPKDRADFEGLLAVLSPVEC